MRTRRVRVFAVLLAVVSAAGACKAKSATGPSQPPADTVTIIAPFVGAANMGPINEAFSATANAPWGFAHGGIDFFPLTTLSPFQAVGAGEVSDVRLWQNGANWQVNVSIKFDSRWTFGYSFEPMTASASDGTLQRTNVLVNTGQTVSQGQLIGRLHKAGNGAHVDFSLLRDSVFVCPEPYFTGDARASVNALVRLAFPGAQMCY